MSPLRPSSSGDNQVFGFDAPYPPTTSSSTIRYTVDHSHPIALFNGHTKASLNGHTHPATNGFAHPHSPVLNGRTPSLKGASKDMSQVCHVISDNCLTKQVNRQTTPAISTQSYRTAVPRPLDLLMT